jgi:hypothetical protein
MHFGTDRAVYRLTIFRNMSPAIVHRDVILKLRAACANFASIEGIFLSGVHDWPGRNFLDKPNQRKIKFDALQKKTFNEILLPMSSHPGHSVRPMYVVANLLMECDCNTMMCKDLAGRFFAVEATKQ